MRYVTPVKQGQNCKDLYMIVDLTKTGKSAISYLKDVPKNGWNDEYRTKKIVLRKISPGSFDYLPGKSFKITKPFYIGVFEVTQKQYELITGYNPAIRKGDMHPVENVSYEDLRGKDKGAQWPLGGEVDEDSFLGILRSKAKLNFDLPTEAQWEYAGRSGVRTAWNNGTKYELILDVPRDWQPNLEKVARYYYNGGRDEFHAPVGSYERSLWGHYDMHGNVYEWCLDWHGPYVGDAVDPKGPEEGEFRIIRGGCCCSGAHDCFMHSRNHLEPIYALDRVGLRLVLTL